MTLGIQRARQICPHRKGINRLQKIRKHFFAMKSGSEPVPGPILNECNLSSFLNYTTEKNRIITFKFGLSFRNLCSAIKNLQKVFIVQIG